MKKSFFCLSMCLWLAAAGVGPAGQADKSRYITLDEIRPGMDAYCLTVLKGTQVEKFPMKVLSIVRNADPGMDMILVVGTDETFKTIGSVHGCSGSPVYIDGRMAGALAAGWDGSLEPLYLVRPIEDMLAIDTPAAKNEAAWPMTADVADLLNTDACFRRYAEALRKIRSSGRGLSPLAISVPASVAEAEDPALKALGFAAISGPDAAMMSAPGGGQQDLSALVPGGVLAVPLCSGDISLAAVGTATEVRGDQVFGFGHYFLGYGDVELPMSAGYVHTVVAHRISSFKFASAGPVLGAIRVDRAAGVLGRIGEIPKMIPLHIRMDRSDLSVVRELNCQLVDNRILTPLILRLAILGASQVCGALPPEHTLDYSIRFDLAGRDPICAENISSGTDIAFPMSEAFASAILLINNSFEPVEIRGIEISLRVRPQLRQAELWAVNLSDTSLRAGEELTAWASLRSYRAEKSVHPLRITIPSDLKPGSYTLLILSRDEYLGFLQKSVPYRFQPQTLDTTLQRMREILNLPRNRLFAVLPLAGGGIALRDQELPNLPVSRAVLLQDSRRLIPADPVADWEETAVSMDWIPAGGAAVAVTIEE